MNSSILVRRLIQILSSVTANDTNTAETNLDSIWHIRCVVRATPVLDVRERRGLLVASAAVLESNMMPLSSTVQSMRWNWILSQQVMFLRADAIRKEFNSLLAHDCFAFHAPDYKPSKFGKLVGKAVTRCLEKARWAVKSLFWPCCLCWPFGASIYGEDCLPSWISIQWPQERSYDFHGSPVAIAYDVVRTSSYPRGGVVLHFTRNKAKPFPPVILVNAKPCGHLTPCNSIETAGLSPPWWGVKH